jgi:hypothetical protein
MYRTVFTEERIELTAKEFSGITSHEGIKDALVSKLKHNEGKCNANGYVKPGSIRLIDRSKGVAENGKFTANWIFDCKYACEVLKPVAYDPRDPDSIKSSVLPALIIDINETGAYCAVEEAIRVLLPRDYHAGNPAFDALKKGSTVRVRMEKHRFQTNDTYIMAVGTLHEGEATEEPMAAAVAEEAEAEEAEAEEAVTEAANTA